MGKMKELFIAMMNEDWEHLSQQEKAFILAEREHKERQLMEQINAEEQLPAKISVVKETENKEEDAKNRHDILPF